MTETTELRAAANASAVLDHFLQVWSDGLSSDIGAGLTCREADALADLLAVNGHGDAAEAWLDAHSASDEEGETHYRSAADDYIVPVDPMDELQCDSCQ